MQVFTLLFSSAKRNGKHSVYTLLIKKVTNTHFKRIRDKMQVTDGNVTPAVNPVVHRLSRNVDASGQFGVAHVFFIITRRRFSCDSYFSRFIVVLILGLVKSKKSPLVQSLQQRAEV